MSSVAGGCNSGRVPLDYQGPVATDWPELLAIAEDRVKPERVKLGDNVRRSLDGRRRGGSSSRLRPELCYAVHRRSGAGARELPVSVPRSFSLHVSCPPDMVYATRQNVYPFSDLYSKGRLLATLQSRPHEVWARFSQHPPLKDRSPVHSLRLLRDLPVPRRLGHRPSPWKTPASRTTSSAPTS